MEPEYGLNEALGLPSVFPILFFLDHVIIWTNIKKNIHDLQKNTSFSNTEREKQTMNASTILYNINS